MVNVEEKQADLFGRKNPIEKNILLNKKFIVPPFSIFDTRAGYWLERRRWWFKLTGDLEESREGTLFNLQESTNEFHKKMINIGSTSRFDPVLTEVIYNWFNIPNGKILDPFGGEQTKGVVAGVLGYPYKAVEFRKEQVDINRERCKDYPKVEYYCGDSKNLKDILKNNDFDLCFTSPPYYDLEVYGKEDSSSMGTYADFMWFYYQVFKQVYDMLKDNRFLVLKVGEIRDKKTGEYRGFVSDNIKIMKKIGFKYYNEIILLNQVGTASLRCQIGFKNRKVCKIHQNILVFYKGDLNKINKIFKIENGEKK